MYNPFKSKGSIQIKGGAGIRKRPNANQINRVTSTGRLRPQSSASREFNLPKNKLQRSLRRVDMSIDRVLGSIGSFGLEDMTLSKNKNRSTAFLRKKIF